MLPLAPWFLLTFLSTEDADRGLHVVARDYAQSLTRGGVVTAELKDGEVRYALAGRPLPDGPEVAAERVVFEIGSISKVFTGLLLAQAVLDGKLALEDPISRHLPKDLRFASPAVGAIRLVELATHTSCLPRLPANLAPRDPGDPYAGYDTEALYSYLTGATLEGTPPCRGEYSNLGMGLLGHVLERVYGVSWGELVATRIAARLGLDDTTVELSEAQRRRLAPPFDGDKPSSNWTFKAMAGAGALRSTAADLIAFVRAIEKADGPLAAAWRLASQPRAELPAAGARVGLGVLIEERDGVRWFAHDGGTGGYRSYLEWAQGGGAARVVLINNGAGVPESLLAKARPTPPPPDRREISLAPDALDEYVGVYELSRQARFTILRDGALLRARLTGQPFFPIHAWRKDDFFYRVVPAELHFVRDDNGRVAALVLHQNGKQLRADRTGTPPPPVRFPRGEDLEPLVGTYALGLATFTVTRRDDTLFAQLTGQPAFPVFMADADRFDYDVVEAQLEFERDGEGRVVALKLHQNGIVQRAARVSSAPDK